MAVVIRQQVLPARVAVGVVDCRAAGRPGQDIPAVVVGVGRGHTVTGHGFQLVQAVVGVTFRQNPVAVDLCDVAHRIVCIRPHIPAVVHTGYQRRGGAARSACRVAVTDGDTPPIYIKITHNSYIVKAELPI